MKKTKCSVCGKEFNIWDEQQEFEIDCHVGYGSEFDGDHIHIDLCCQCLDDMMNNYFLPRCKTYPFLFNEES